MSDASLFISNRKYSITENRIKNIFWYMGECYLLLLNSKKQYSKSYVKNHTSYHFEEFLRFRFVEDFLIPNKERLKRRTSLLDEISFTAETQKEFIDSYDQKQKVDKIDIFVSRLGLSGIWGDCEEKIYFAVECKRITGTRDVALYVGDIKKFTNRMYLDVRLPFEGQLGFVESKLISHEEIVKKINLKLQHQKEIATDLPLEHLVLNDNITGSYISKHKRNTINKEPFTVYHMFLDFWNIITD